MDNFKIGRVAFGRTFSQFRSIFSTLGAGAVSLDLFTRKPITFGQVHRLSALSPRELESQTLGIFTHIYYEEFVEEFLEYLQGMPAKATLFFSVTSSRIKVILESALSVDSRLAEIRVVPNRGRNFGPLLVEFAQEMGTFDFVLHVHSKRSTHTSKSLSAFWSHALISRLLGAESLGLALTVLLENGNVGLIYPDVASRFRQINHYWGANRKPLARSQFFRSKGGTPNWARPVAYPVGGMFLVRSAALKELLNFQWTYEMFPKENSQLDGTLQHAIERYVGFSASLHGFEHAVFTNDLNVFDSFYDSDAVRAKK